MYEPGDILVITEHSDCGCIVLCVGRVLKWDKLVGLELDSTILIRELINKGYIESLPIHHLPF